MKATKNLAWTAMLTALGVVLLYLACVLPTGGIGVTAVAGILPALVVLRCGLGWSAMHYAAVTLLALLLLPDKTFALWYALVLGHYGILKSLIERLRKPALEWVLKLAVYACCVALLVLLFQKAFLAVLPDWNLAVLLAVLAAVFVLYDIGFSGVLAVYQRRIGRYFH